MKLANQSPHIKLEATRRGVHSVLLKDDVDEAGLLRAVEAAIDGKPPATATTVHKPPIASRTGCSVSSAVSLRAVTVSDAKHAVAVAFGVSPENVEVKIRI